MLARPQVAAAAFGRRPMLLQPVCGRLGRRTVVRTRAESLLSEPASAEEEVMRPRRGANVFTFKRWSLHRDTNQRYLRHMRTLLGSSTWTKLTQPLTVLTGVAVAICSYQTAFLNGQLPEWAPKLLLLSDSPFELTSFAISLLLVFRTDSSYGRWTEAMGCWTEVRNTSKDMVRDVVCWIKDPALRSLLVRWTLAFSKSLKVYLRENGDITQEMAKLLLPHERARLCSQCYDTGSAYPQYVLHVLTQAVERAGLSEIREDKLLGAIAQLNKAVGSCEKILRYPIPLSYTRHTSRFMIIYLTFLPLALWDDCGWATVPITTIISFLLLGTEEIGVQIEEPFSLLPLEDFCKDIEKDLANITVSRHEVDGLLDASLSSTGNTDLAAAVLEGPALLERANVLVGAAHGHAGFGSSAGGAGAGAGNADKEGSWEDPVDSGPEDGVDWKKGRRERAAGVRKGPATL